MTDFSSARASCALLSVLLWAACAHAQPAPTVTSTLRTTSTAATSVRVGCTEAGSCTGGIVAGPIDVASVTSGGFIGIANNVPASQTFRLVNNAGTLQWNGIALATGSSLSGTIGKLAKFTAADAVGDSICSESGTTITCVNTIAATTGTFTNVGGTLTTASQTAITGVGTITTGVWNGTLIDLTRGGTGANLSGTGGTSQFLRQNTVGGNVTVVRPAVADLSDASNVALLNANNAFTGGTQAIGTGTTGTNTAFVTLNGGSGAGGGGAVSFQRNSVLQGAVGNSSAIVGGASNNTIIYSASSNGIDLYSNALLRWGINAAGDWTVGASAHIADSNGAPTLGAGFGTGAAIAGTDYAFLVTIGSGTSSSGQVDFGHTWTTAPVCGLTGNASALSPLTTSSTTTALVINYTSADHTGQIVYVLCRSY